MLLLYFLLLPLHITQEGQQHIDLYGYPFCHQIFPIKERWVVPLLVFQFEFFFAYRKTNQYFNILLSSIANGKFEKYL
jgi:hypothetical protein